MTGTAFTLCGGANSGQICLGINGGYSCQTCGAIAGPCCPNGTGGGACQIDAYCAAWSGATSGNTGNAGSCIACGKTGQVCCPGSPATACDPGLFCSGASCLQCGLQPGNPCCTAPYPSWATGGKGGCATGMACGITGTCINNTPPATCGGAGQPCCTTAPQCQPGLTCNLFGDGACN